LKLAAVCIYERQVGFDINVEFDLFAALLVRDQICRRTKNVAYVERMSFARSYTAEIKQSRRDRFAPKRLTLDQTEIFVEVLDLPRSHRTRLPLHDARAPQHTPRSLRADCLFHALRRQQAVRRPQVSRASNRVNGFNAKRNVLTDSDDMRNLVGFRVEHWDLADQPMFRRSVVRDRLLLDAFDLARLERTLKFHSNTSLRIPGEHAKNISTDRRITRNALRADLAVPVPTDNAVIAIDHVDRYRQCIEHGFRKPPVLLFCLIYRAVLLWLRNAPTRFMLIAAICVTASISRPFVSEKVLLLCKSNDDRTFYDPVDVKRRNVFQFVLTVG
jgi:hypothetical protein